MIVILSTVVFGDFFPIYSYDLHVVYVSSHPSNNVVEITFFLSV